jgi:putative spermidine/putrescine transport system ATP-binding protein
MGPAAIHFSSVSRYFGDVKAVDSIDLEIQDGEFFTFLGPSGSGKTTSLRMVAGFEHPTSGSIFLHGTDVSNLPLISAMSPPYFRITPCSCYDGCRKRRLRVDDQKVPKTERLRRVEEMLSLVRLPLL